MAIPIIGDIIDKVIGKAGDVAGELIVDKDKRNELQVNLERLKIEETSKAEQRLHEQMMGQIEINKVEAGNSNMFVAGWRPAIGWIGAVGIGYSFVLEPIMSWSARVILDYNGTFPSLNYSELMILVAGMLGFGGFRSFEKVKGVVTDEPSPSPPAAKTAKKPQNLLPSSFNGPLPPPEDTPWSK